MAPRRLVVLLAVPFILAIGVIAQSKPPVTPVVTADTIVYVTKTGAKYHTATCRSLSRSKIAMKLGDASLRYDACRICKPPVLPDSAKPSSTAKPAAATPAPAPAHVAPASRQCAAITKQGKRCSRTARPGSAYCWQHGG